MLSQYLYFVTITLQSYVTTLFHLGYMPAGWSSCSADDPPVEDHMMFLCCFVMFCIWLQGRSPNSELNGVFVQHGSSLKRESAHMAASNKAVKMSAAAQRQHTPPGSCCLPAAHLQIIYCGTRCQSVLSGYSVCIQFWVRGPTQLHKELERNGKWLQRDAR